MHSAIAPVRRCITALTSRLSVYTIPKRFANWYKQPKDYEPPQIYPFKRMRGPRRLGAALLKIFPGKDQRPKQIGDFTHPTTGERIELEFYIPELKLAFEYQDPHKFSEAWYAARCPLSFQWRDDVKRKVITDKGETLITIPSWWDGNIESLKASVHVRRPELLPPGQKIRAAPILLMSQPMYFNVNIVPDIGEMMLASFAMSTQFDGENWWMGEKYDGVRACWNPLVHKFFRRYSRNGKELSIPRKFMKAFPDVFLDSEIWFGRGCFGDSLAISSHAHKNLVAWGLIRWVSFDCPNPFLQKTYTFEERYEQLLTMIPVEHHFLMVASRVLCYNHDHLMYYADEIVNDDGEGLMLRMPQSPYVNGRTDLLIKIKAERDQEGFVTSIDSRTSVTLTGPDGKSFPATIPSEFPKDDPVKEGDIVTFSFNTFTKDGKPNRAQIVRKRHDCTWSEIVEIYQKDAQTAKDKEKEKEKPKKGRKK